MGWEGETRVWTGLPRGYRHLKSGLGSYSRVWTDLCPHFSEHNRGYKQKLASCERGKQDWRDFCPEAENTLAIDWILTFAGKFRLCRITSYRQNLDFQAWKMSWAVGLSIRSDLGVRFSILYRYSEVMIWDMGSQVNKKQGEVEMAASILFLVGKLTSFLV